MTHTLCIGLTGRMGSGKGEVVKILEDIGFKYTSLSDMVREEAARMGREVTRAEMQDIGNRLRTEGGAGVLGKRIAEKILADTSNTPKWIIDGIRNPAEITELRKLKSFFLVGIDANIETILERIKSRKRTTDLLDEDELRKRLDREWGIGEPEGGQQVGKCMPLVDFTLTNNAGLDELKTNLTRVLNKIYKKQ